MQLFIKYVCEVYTLTVGIEVFLIVVSIIIILSELFMSEWNMGYYCLGWFWCNVFILFIIVAIWLGVISRRLAEVCPVNYTSMVFSEVLYYLWVCYCNREWFSVNGGVIGNVCCIWFLKFDRVRCCGFAVLDLV